MIQEYPSTNHRHIVTLLVFTKAEKMGMVIHHIGEVYEDGRGFGQNADIQTYTDTMERYKERDTFKDEVMLFLEK